MAYARSVKSGRSLSLEDQEDELSSQLKALNLQDVTRKDSGIGHSSSSSNGAQSAIPTVTAEKSTYIQNAHKDDIHAMINVGSQTFVTGSKDGALKLWDLSGKLIKDVWQPDEINYCEWITALAPFDADQWISGTRSGNIRLWGNDGNEIRSFKATPFRPPRHKCKERNMTRINCIVKGISSDESPVFHVGWPTQFTTHRLCPKPERINHCVTSQNDWVFCVTPLNPKKLMVVTGAKLDIWEQFGDIWKRTVIISECRQGSVARAHQRHFISGVTALQANPRHYGLAVFGGIVQVLDITARRIIKTFNEHEKRVWMIENISDGIFASCSDDQTIKMWDIRCPKSVITLWDKLGRVSTMLKLTDHKLVSGSCPDDLPNASEKARLTFWDLRIGKHPEM